MPTRRIALGCLTIVLGGLLSCDPASCQVAAPDRSDAADTAAADKTAIQRVISAQIEAFRREDGSAALAFAAPGIAQKFADGEQFLDMVRTSYPAVFRPRSFSFGELNSDDGTVEQKVEFIGSDGGAALGIYSMEHEPDGSWRISGCELQPSERIEL